MPQKISIELTTVNIDKLKFVVLSLAITLLLTACEEPTLLVEQPELRLVRTQVVSARTGANWREFPGVVDAAQHADLGFRVAGKLAKIKVLEGEQVQKNQLLATLDDTDFQIQLRSRQADYDKAKADYQRAKSLLQQKLIAKSDFDQLEAQHAASLATLTAARQNVEYTRLKAPFAGRIAQRYVDNYEDISTMQAIFTLQDMSSIHIKVNIPETIMIRLKADYSAAVYAIFDAIPQQQFPLALQEVATQADPGSRTFAVTFSMPGVEAFNILPGMSVTVRGTRPDSSDTNAMAMVVPSQAIIENNEGRFAFVVEKLADKQGVITRREVRTGNITEQGLVVLSGLQPGDHLVVAGMSKMSPGLAVRVSEEWSQ